MNATRTTMTPQHFGFVSLRWPLVITAVAILIGSVGWGARMWLQKLDHLVELGWAAYLGQERSNLIVFVSACARDTVCQPVLAQAWQQVRTDIPWALLGIAFFASALGAAVAATLGRAPALQKSPGGARWATQQDLRPLLHDKRGTQRRGYLGIHPTGRLLRPPERLRCAHTLLVGGTGAGKSTSYYKPNLLMDALDACSAVVIDLKYPDATSGLFDLIPAFAEAGHDVQLFLPFHTDTLRLPLLQGAEDSVVAAQITDILTPLSDTGGDGGFFSKQQRALLAGLILGFARSGETSLAAVVKLLLSGTLEVAAYVRSHPDPEVRERLGGLFEQDTRIRHGVVRGLVEELELFTDPRLARSTTPSQESRENIDLTTLGTRPTLLYIGIPQDELMRTRGQTLLQLIKRVLDSVLIRTASAHGGQLPVHTSVYLDEFASLGPLPNIGESFATMRSRRVAYHVSLQNRAQGEAVYGRAAFYSFISGNVQQTLVFPRHLSFEDASYFSEAMGELTAVSLSTGVTRKHLFDPPNYHRRQQEVGRPLLSVEEMRDWPEGMGVLLQGGIPPTKVLLPRLDQRRLLGVRNPLFQSYRNVVPRKVEVLELARCLVAGRKNPVHEVTAQRRLQELKRQYVVSLENEPAAEPKSSSSELEDLSPKVTEEILGNVTRPALSTNDAHQALRGWLEVVLEQQIPVHVERVPHRKHEVASLIVPRASLPIPLQNPQGLKVWLTQGWVRQTGDSITILENGLKIIGEGRVKRLRVLHERHQKRQKEQSSRVRIKQALTPFRKDKTAEQLHAWVAANGHALDGHPDYLKLSNDAKTETDVLGWYQPRSIRLPNETFKQLLGELPEDLQAVRLANRQGSEVLVSDLERFPKLAAWCHDHVHLLVGHPAFEARADKDELEPIGMYQEEAVALPKREYQRILGIVPEEMLQRDLTLGHGPERRKRRLQAYTFTDEGGL